MPLVTLPYLIYLFPIIATLSLVASALLSPLRRVPSAQPLARFTSLWILFKRFKGVENATIKAAHVEHGAVVLLGPNEISVNCVKGGLTTVYSGGMEKPLGKDGWYSVFANFGIPNMFATDRSKAHSQRKRMLSNIYSKSYIQASSELAARSSKILQQRLFPLLRDICDAKGGAGSEPSEYRLRSGACNAYYLVCGLTMDLVTAYLFGLSAGSDFTRNPAACRNFLDLYNSRHGFPFWFQEVPVFTRMMKRLGLISYFVPSRVGDANAEIEEWTLDMVNQAKQAVDSGEDLGPEDTPIVYQQLRNAMSKEASKDLSSRGPEPEQDEFRHLSIASEMLDHHAAGFDTSGITLTYLIHELSLPIQQPIQDRLREELRSLSPQVAPGSELSDAKAIDALPFLQAILWETLRLHPAIPGPQPRETPNGGCFVGPSSSKSAERSGGVSAAETGGASYFVPGGKRISANAFSLHANAEVFPEPEKFKPERWFAVGDERKEMDRWFWAFGSGGRMCVGSNLAIYQMKLIIAAIYTTYRTRIVDDEGIEQDDAYTARPKGRRLIVGFEPVD